MSGDRHPDVAIVGGGVIGLSAAYVLSHRGVRVTVLDRGLLGRAASWAGAGILSPAASKPPAGPFVALRSRSARLHAEWAEQLRDETGIDNGYRRSGGVDVALTEDEEIELHCFADAWRDEGVAFEWLEGRQIQSAEPALSDHVRAACFLPGRAQIRNPRHVRALAVACERRGVSLRPGLAAEGFEAEAGRVRAVRTSEGSISCQTVILAAGPWTADLLRTLGIDLATPPVKGQIVLLRSQGNGPRRIVERGKNYLVPRDDGRVLVGATEEDAGFDTRSTPVAVRDLIDEALTLCPSLASAEVERAWAGLRPGSKDGVPYIGWAPGWGNLLVASGHRRVGLQLSTGTAEAVADLLLGATPRFDLSAFALDRPRPEATPGGAFRS